MLGKLLGIATVGSTLASVGLMHRLLVATAQIMVLVIASAFMLCASLLALFYIIYLGLLQCGVPPDVAAITLGVAALLVTAALVMLTLEQLRQLRVFQQRQMLGAGNAWPEVGNIAMAFVDGFLNHKK